MTPEAPRLVPARRGFSIKYRDTQLLSTIDPIRQAERIVQDSDIRPQNLYLCPSPLLGYGLDLLLARKDPSSAILCVETDPQLHELSHNALSSLLETRSNDIVLAPVEANTPATLLAYLESCWPPRRFRRVISIKTNRAWMLDGDRHTALEQALGDHIHRAWQNTITLIRLGQRYTGNLIRNLPLLSRVPSFTAIQGSQQDVLALGAGPGLDPLLDELLARAPGIRSKAERPFAILCVDTALRPLLERGIQPDAVLALEAQYWNLLDFIGTDTPPLIMDLASHYATWRVATTQTNNPELLPKALVATEWAPLKLFDRLAAAKLLPLRLPPLGSVGLSLVELARSLTRGRIIIGGLDFAYSADNFHAKGTSHSVMHECSTWRLKGLFRPERAFRPGVHQHHDKRGLPALSDPALESYRELFRTQFAREHRILDAGPTGLDLGLTRITPEAAAAMLMEEKKSTADSPLRATINGERERPRASGLEIGDFIKTEQKALERLRNILSGREQALNDELVTLLDALDYLWAHFAEYQGTRSTAELSADRSFLKRVRAGIDRSLKDWTIATEVLNSFNDSGQAREISRTSP